MNKDTKYDFRLSKKHKMQFMAAATRHGCKNIGDWLIKLAIKELNKEKGESK